MKTAVLFDASEMNAYIGMALVPIIGPAARSNNYLGFIQSVLQSILSPDSDGPQYGPYQEMFRYNVSEEQVDEILTVIVSDLYRIIHGNFPNLVGHSLFRVDALPTGVIRIAYIGEHSGMVPHSTLNPMMNEIHNQHEQVVRQIHSDLDAGHYLPPQVRRMVGY